MKASEAPGTGYSLFGWHAIVGDGPWSYSLSTIYCGAEGYFWALSPHVHDPEKQDGEAARELLGFAFFGSSVCVGWSA